MTPLHMLSLYCGASVVVENAPSLCCLSVQRTCGIGTEWASLEAIFLLLPWKSGKHLV